MRISIFGLGYVGAVSLACLARDGHQLIGIDIDQEKLQQIARGNSPIIEDGVEELMAEAIAGGRVSITRDVTKAVLDSDLSMICVGTPSSANGSQDQAAVISLSEELARALAQKGAYHILVFRSTLTPGTIEDRIKPLIEERSGLRDGKDFDICFQPEFMREGSSVKDYYDPPMTVVGTRSERAAQALREIFGHSPAAFRVTSIRTAEMLKYCCNNFHALKITFANEVGRLCEALGCDAFEVMDLVCQDTRLNISPAYLKPGFAFGGSCLPKDLRATQYMAKMSDVEMPMISSILHSNELHIRHVKQKIMESGRHKIGFIGLSFKTGTDDLRESPLVMLAETLIGKGLSVLIYDPYVNLSKLRGRNRNYIERAIPHLNSLMLKSCRAVVEQSEIVLLGTNQKDLLAEVSLDLKDHHLVLDLVGLPEMSKLPARYQGSCW